MAFTDHTIDAYVFPQDGASSGISDFDADWQNAAYVGGLAKAQTADYTPEGVDVTVDYGNNTFDLSSGLSFIEDPQDIEFRDWDDSEQVRSGLWTEGYLSVMLVPSVQDIPLENNTSVNHIYLGWDRTAQNNTFVRVADTENAPTIGVKIETIDPVAGSSAPKNRVAGYSWNFLGKHETGGFVGEANVQWPENGYDEYKVKFIDVQGQGTSSGQQLHGRINNVTSGYHFRTTQNNSANVDRFKILQGEGGAMHIGGHLYFSMHGDRWQYDNRLTSNEEKQYSFSGQNYNTSVNPINSMQLFWSSGKDISGTFNIWGRNTL